MIIRTAQPSDAEAIAEIWNEIIQNTARTFTTDTKSVSGIDNDIAERGDAFIVAELGTDVVGFATYFPFRSGPGYAFTKEHSVNIRTDAWGRGVGRSLMVELETIAKAEGVHSLIAGVSGENSDGVAFHASIGFEVVARLSSVGRKFDRWMDLVLMQKFL